MIPKLIILTIAFMGCTQNRFTDMKWLEGEWRHTNLEYPAFEHWEVQGVDLMTGYGYQIETNGDTTIVEKFKIYEKGRKIYYSAQVLGDDAEIVLPLVSSSDSQLIFESTDRSFPQRICYTKLSYESINSELSGIIDGQKKAFEFKMKKQ